MENTVWAKARYQYRSDTAENWGNANPILLAGEHGVVIDSDIPHQREKIGDGKTPWNELGWYHGPRGEVGPRGEKGDKGEDGTMPYINIAEDGKSLLIGDTETNIAGTKAFIIIKAVRETKDDGSYNYYYYLLDDRENSLLEKFKEVLIANPEATNSLRTYYIDSNGTLSREYAEDYAKTYEVFKDGEYLVVRVEKVKKTFQPIPDNGNPLDNIKDEDGNWRYEWKLTDDANLAEIDYTDTWDYNGQTEYSYLRLAVDPYLGTEWIETNGTVAGGSGNKSLGKNSFVAGSDNTANGTHAAVLGDENYANYAGFVAGRKNKVLEKSGTALGEKNIVKGYGGVALGGKNEVNDTFASAIGEELKTRNRGEVVVGSYNALPSAHSKNVSLSVGGGWSEDTRKDVMTVYQDGETVVAGKLTAAGMNINDVLESGTISFHINNLPDKGELNKLYIVVGTDEVGQYIYKVRKTPKVENVWDGTSTKPINGTGTEDDPYQITNGSELNWAITSSDNIFPTKDTSHKHYKLMNDIYLNDISKINWSDGSFEDGYTPNEWDTIPSRGDDYGWSGIFDGDNHTIYGLYYNKEADGDFSPTGKGSALFPKITGNWRSVTSIIKNLELDYCYINSHSIAGSLIGYESTAIIEVDNCAIGSNVWLYSMYVADIGVYGDAKVKITNCYSLSHKEIKDSNGNKAFALAWHWTYNGSVINCYTLDGAITTSSASITKSNCYVPTEDERNVGKTKSGVTYVKQEDMLGINALKNMPLLSGYINDYTYYPHLASFKGEWKFIGGRACD